MDFPSMEFPTFTGMALPAHYLRAETSESLESLEVFRDFSLPQIDEYVDYTSQIIQMDASRSKVILEGEYFLRKYDREIITPYKDEAKNLQKDGWELYEANFNFFKQIKGIRFLEKEINEDDGLRYIDDRGPRIATLRYLEKEQETMVSKGKPGRI